MSISGWITLSVCALLALHKWKSKEWSVLKCLVYGIAVTVVCIFVCPSDSSIITGGSSSSEPLLEKGKEYVFQNLRDPSTANVLTYVPVDRVRRAYKEEWNVSYASNCDILSIEVEATNGFGGRNREDYLVFFKDGVPVGMELSSEITKDGLLRAISWYF